jgi:hypothetical protein
MNRSLAVQRMLSALYSQSRKSRALQAVEAACFRERNAHTIHADGEPDLPEGYRHIRSAIGALLIVGRDYGF